MFDPAPRFAKLAELSSQTSSEGRRELLRQVTEQLSSHGGSSDMAGFDQLLSAVASDYSTQVRADLAKLISGNDAQFACSAQLFALDEIAVAEPVLRHSKVLTEDTLLKVIAEKGQTHMMAVTGRQDISERISHALVEKGDDHVVSSLLKNDGARIAAHTYEAVAVRAQDSEILQAPLVRRADVPADLLNDLYVKVEKGLRQEILKKFNHLSEAELEEAFHRSRERLSKQYGGAPEDMAASTKRINAMARQNLLQPATLVTPAARRRRQPHRLPAGFRPPGRCGFRTDPAHRRQSRSGHGRLALPRRQFRPRLVRHPGDQPGRQGSWPDCGRRIRQAV